MSLSFKARESQKVVSKIISKWILLLKHS